MYQQLYQYLITHGQLSLPGTGMLKLEKEPARNDFAEKRISPPAYNITFDPQSGNPSTQFFNWLAAALQIQVQEAIIRFNDFAFALKKQISQGDIVEWSGIGKIEKGLGNDTRFTPAFTNKSFEEPVPAEKVIREKAEHMVRVGEQEKTSVEMTAMLTKTVRKRSSWQITALILGIAAAGFLTWYFIDHGFTTTTVSNSNKLVPAETASPR